MKSAPPDLGEAGAASKYGKCRGRQIPYNTPHRPTQPPPDNWRQLGAVVSDVLPNLVARRFDLTRQHARAVVEHNFNLGDRS